MRWAECAFFVQGRFLVEKTMQLGMALPKQMITRFIFHAQCGVTARQNAVRSCQYYSREGGN